MKKILFLLVIGALAMPFGMSAADSELPTTVSGIFDVVAKDAVEMNNLVSAEYERTKGSAPMPAAALHKVDRMERLLDVLQKRNVSEAEILENMFERLVGKGDSFQTFLEYFTVRHAMRQAFGK